MLSYRTKAVIIGLYLSTVMSMVCLVLWVNYDRNTFQLLQFKAEDTIFHQLFRTINYYDRANTQKTRSSQTDGGDPKRLKSTSASLGEISKSTTLEKMDGKSSSAKVKFWLYPENWTESSLLAENENGSCYPQLYPIDATFDAVPVPSDCGEASGVTVGRSSNPVQHIFFLKTHKTGSQTLTGILNRYALTHNLSVAIRKRLAAHDAQFQKKWIPSIRPLPPRLSHYDMLTDHVRFDEKCVRHFLPEDAVFISIVREPLDRFVSAFFFSKNVWQNPHLNNIPGPDPILTYLSDIPRWDRSFGTITHSKTAFDFGLEFKSLQQNPRYLQTFIRYLSRVFHLVLLTEAFDESAILLKRTLSWDLQDMLYIRFNVGKTRRAYNFTQTQRDDFRTFRQEEYALYRHFRSEFYKKIRAQDDTFPAEVEVFKIVRNKVETFCRKVIMNSRATGKKELRVEGTKFNGRFRVRVEDCRFLFKESSSIKDIWFERKMLQRLLSWSKTWTWGNLFQ